MDWYIRTLWCLPRFPDARSGYNCITSSLEFKKITRVDIGLCFANRRWLFELVQDVKVLFSNSIQCFFFFFPLV
jgi:hypothetical protein